jgi:hypothetical protein
MVGALASRMLGQVRAEISARASDWLLRTSSTIWAMISSATCGMCGIRVPHPAECGQPSRGRKADSDIGKRSLVEASQAVPHVGSRRSYPHRMSDLAPSWCEGAKDCRVSGLDEKDISINVLSHFCPSNTQYFPLN